MCIGASRPSGLVCSYSPFWETLDKSVMILVAFLLLEGAELVKGMAERRDKD